MKVIFIAAFFILLCDLSAFSQTVMKHDSLYYLLDTAKTSKNNRMWKIEGSNGYKYYTILCPCVRNGGMPTFIAPDSETDKYLNKNSFASLHQIALAELIKKVKKLYDTSDTERLALFIIQPRGKAYTLGKVHILKVLPREASNDFEILPRNTSKHK